ncbi:MAG: adenylate/guanylate cyclase domain-containing protein, partial [Gammaproteobacteria bacterium]
MRAQLTKYLTWLMGKPVQAKLPQRVLDTIRAQQEASEVLVGWLQLGAVFVFGLLYTVAPKTFSEDVAFEPVPWVLLAYFIFTVIRLVLAHQRRMPNWLIYVSVVADMMLLLGLIWSFHLQYEQPASFYLKAPTLLYVFIFIALRALHLEVRFIALAGIVAAIGWSLMVLYVVTID